VESARRHLRANHCAAVQAELVTENVIPSLEVWLAQANLVTLSKFNMFCPLHIKVMAGYLFSDADNK
jgi:hypothetical protein